MSYPAIVVIIIYVAWGAATIANQFHSWCPVWLRSLDIFGLVPVWTFFAPNPGMTDYYLLYRDRLPDGSFDNWRKVDLKEAENGFRLAFWNPAKRKHKALSDIVSSLVRLAKHRQSETLIVSVPYLLILNLVTSRPHSLGANGTQFMVLEHGGFSGEPERSRVIVMSAIHGLP
ncbi:MAG TPA: hypothetical protein VFS35_10640 [Terrimicrobiaceae bacterium]|nr:hypothetical protein [Terrimicrobiaceae bacterium]